MAGTNQVVQLFPITEINNDSAVIIDRNFKQIQRLLSILQVYMNKTGYDTLGNVITNQGNWSLSYQAIVDMANDGKLTPLEKQAILKEWMTIQAEKIKLDAEAATYSLSDTDPTSSRKKYIDQYNALESYLTALLTDLSTTSDIDGNILRTNFKNYYDASADLSKTMGESVKTIADTATTAATNAQTSANQANTEITNMASDDKISPVEKIGLKKDYDTIIAEKSILDTQGNTYGVTTEKINYDNDYTTLDNYLNRNATFTRSSVAYLSDGTQVASGQPRIENGGVMIEEGTTNLIVNPSFETDTVGWLQFGNQSMSRVTTDKYFGNACMQLIATGAGNGALGIVNTFPSPAVINGTQYTVSFWAKSISGNTSLHTELWGGIGSTNFTLTTQWQKFTALFTGSTQNNFYFWLNNAGTCIIDGVQLEQKPYATSFTDSTRQPETLTIPTAGVLNVSEGTVEISFNVDSSGNHSANNPNWSIPFSVSSAGETNQISFRRTPSSTQWYVFSTNSIGTPQSVILSNALSSGIHKVTFAWKQGIGGFAYLDGVKMGTIISDKLPSAFDTTTYLGSAWWVGAADQLDSPIYDFCISSTQRTDADILARAGATEFAVDGNVTAKLPFDTNLLGSVGVFTNMSATTDLGTGGGATLRSNFSNYYTAKVNLLNKVANVTKAIADSSIQQNTLYNGVSIGDADGVVVTRSDGLVKSMLNATDGIKIQQNVSGTMVDQFYVDINGQLHFNGAYGGTINVSQLLIDKLSNLTSELGNVHSDSIRCNDIWIADGEIRGYNLSQSNSSLTAGQTTITTLSQYGTKGFLNPKYAGLSTETAYSIDINGVYHPFTYTDLSETQFLGCSGVVANSGNTLISPTSTPASGMSIEKTGMHLWAPDTVTANTIGENEIGHFNIGEDEFHYATILYINDTKDYSAGGSRIVEDTDPGIVYTGTWYTGSSASNHGGTTHYGAETGLKATYIFTGTGITYYSPLSNNFGYVHVFLDGVQVLSKDLYSATTIYQYKVYENLSLTNTTHTIEIQYTSTKNPSSSGFYIDLDYFYVTTPVPFANPTIDVYSTNSNRIANIIGGNTTTTENVVYITSSSPNNDALYVNNTYNGTGAEIRNNSTKNYSLYVVNDSTKNNVLPDANAGAAFFKGGSGSIATIYLQNVLGGSLLETPTGSGIGSDGIWYNTSSKKSKENFSDMYVLEKVRKLPIKKYNYKASKGCNDRKFYFTPMAEDFYKSFNIGDDKHISPADLGGVALQAIKELAQQVDELKQEIAELKQKK